MASTSDASRSGHCRQAGDDRVVAILTGITRMLRLVVRLVLRPSQRTTDSRAAKAAGGSTAVPHRPMGAFSMSFAGKVIVIPGRRDGPGSWPCRTNRAFAAELGWSGESGQATTGPRDARPARVAISL